MASVYAILPSSCKTISELKKFNDKFQLIAKKKVITEDMSFIMITTNRLGNPNWAYTVNMYGTCNV